MLSEACKRELIQLCCDLVKRPSYSGEEREVAELLRKGFLRLGFDEILSDEYGNIIGHIKGNKPGKKILLDGHMDVVPVDASKWQHAPFGAEVVDGRIYGRGTSDMKGSVAAIVYAAGCFAQDCKRNFAGDIYVSGVVHEECFEGVSAREISARVNPDYVIICEPSELTLMRGQRGRAEIVLETYGRAAHSANPQNGINAVKKMMKLIEAIDQLALESHPFLGDGILELTDIKSSPYPGASVVPDYCKVTYDRRLLVGETKESVLKPIIAIIEQAKTVDPDLRAEVKYATGTEHCYTGNKIEGERFFPAWIFDENDELVQAALSGIRKAGLNSAISHFVGCTNGSHYAGEAGIKTIGFGPSKESIAHIDDEYIEVDQLLKAAEGYYCIIEEVLNLS